jgi:hypothetical protein
MIIHCRQLTTCNAIEGGECVQLDLIDTSGNPVSLRLPFAHAESIAMTLPRLLTRAVKAKTGDQSARYVFPLGGWFLENSGQRGVFILTMKTTDGFEASFHVPVEACKALGWALHHEAKAAIELNDAEKGIGPASQTELN